MQYESRHLAFLSENSLKAAEASEAAAEQGKFWEYRELLFKNQAAVRNATPDNFKTWASDIGLDRAKFDAAFDSGRYAAKVQADIAEAKRLGVNRTPTIIVNGQKVEGASGVPTPEELKAAVDQALAQKKGS